MEKTLYGKYYTCDKGQDPNYIEHDAKEEGKEYAAEDLVDWVANIFVSVIYNIAKVFNADDDTAMPKIKEVLVKSKLYKDFPDLLKNVTDETLN